MPSNTTPLLETDDTEPDLPVPNLYGRSLLDDDDPSGARDTSHLAMLGAVLDLRPLSRTGSEEENHHIGFDADTEQLRGLDPVPGVGEAGHRDPGGVMMAMMMIQEGERCVLNTRRKSVNTTECVMVPTSEHVAEIVGRQGCKIKALRAKTNTYIKTPMRGDEPVFVVTGRREDVISAKREILSAAEHFSLIRASRNKAALGSGLPAVPCHPGQTSIQVRVPYRMVGLVVGPKGATIKRIQQQTHTYIVTPSRDKEPVFEVSGMPENVDRARDEIQAHIALRTARSVETNPDDDDFHYNGTDVGFAAPGGSGAWLFCGSGVRNSSSSSLGSSSGDSHPGGAAELSPASSYGAATFWFGGARVVQEESDGMRSGFERGGASLPATPRLSPSLLGRASPSRPDPIDLVRLPRENSPSLSAFSHDM